MIFHRWRLQSWVLLPLLLLRWLTSGLLQVQTTSPTLHPQGQAAFQDVKLTISTPDARVLTWRDALEINDVTAHTVDIQTSMPYAEYTITPYAFVNQDMSSPLVLLTLFDAFNQLMQAPTADLVQQLQKQAFTPSGVGTRNTAQLPLNPVQQMVAQQYRNDSGPSMRRRLLQAQDCTTQVTVDCILARCSAALTTEFATELFSFCTSAAANITGATTEQQQTQSAECVLAGACRATTQCSTGPTSAADQTCLENLISEMKTTQTEQLNAQRSQQLTFMQQFLTMATDNIRGYTQIATVLANVTQTEINQSNQTLAVLAQKQQLLTNITNVLGQLSQQQSSIFDTVSSYTSATDALFAQHGQLILDTINEVQTLVTINANLRLSILSALNVVQEQDTLAQLHTTSLIQTASQTYAVWQGVAQALLQLIQKPQVHTELARRTQAMMIQLEASSAMQFFGRDPGVAPQELPFAQRYVTLGTSWFAWVDEVEGGAKRLRTTFSCDLQQFVLDQNPRNIINAVPQWFVPDCWTALNESEILTLALSDDNLTEATAQSGCRCWMLVALDVSHDLTLDSNTTGADQLLFNETLYTRNVDAVAVMNRTRFLSFLQQDVCTDVNSTHLHLWTQGLGTASFTLDADPTLRTYCQSDPALAELWVQPETVSRTGNVAPIPLVFYQRMLLLMTGMENLILQGFVLIQGRLPVPSTLTSSSYQLTAPASQLYDQFIADVLDLDLLTTDGNSGNPVAIQTSQLQYSMSSPNSIATFELSNLHWVVDGQVQSTNPGAVEILQTNLVRNDVAQLPGSFMLAGWPGCFKMKCPVRPTFLDPATGYVMGFQTKPDVQNTLGFFNTALNSSIDNGTTSGYQMHIYDVPQSLFSKSNIETTQRNKVTYVRALTDNIRFNSFLQNGTDIYLGPNFQRSAVTFEDFANNTIGSFRPEFAVVPLKLFRTAITNAAVQPNLAPIANGGGEQIDELFSTWTDVHCTGPRYAAADTTLCSLMDRFRFDFNVTRGTLRLYPRVAPLEVVARILATSNSSSASIGVRPAASDSAGRQLTSCPDELTFQNSETDYTHFSFLYRLLPVGTLNRTLTVTVTNCSASYSTGPAGGGQIAVRVPSQSGTPCAALDTSCIQPFATLTVSLPGCTSQITTVQISGPGLPTNTCVVWQSTALPVGIEVIENEAQVASAVRQDALSSLLDHLGAQVASMQNSTLLLAQQAITDTFSTRFNATENEIDHQLRAQLAKLGNITTNVTNSIATVHSNAVAMLADLATLKQSLNETLVRPEDVAAAFNNTDTIRAILAQEEVILGLFEAALNVTRAIVRNLTGIDFIFGRAPTDFSWNNSAAFILALQGVTCPASWDALTEKAMKAAAEANRCDLTVTNFFTGKFLGLSCLSGNLLPLRYAIWALFFAPINVCAFLLGRVLTCKNTYTWVAPLCTVGVALMAQIVLMGTVFQ